MIIALNPSWFNFTKYFYAKFSHVDHFKNVLFHEVADIRSSFCEPKCVYQYNFVRYNLNRY